MEDLRPDPDLLLERMRAEEARARRGRLKIFFGAAPGVGKTYAMLEAARQKKAEGADVVAGVVETHGRSETAALIEGFERLPPRTLSHRGVELTELDLDAALRRRPGLLLVDELAHTNAEGSRHRKRWQDVGELLAAGIDVFTTLNVQHIESLNDVIAQITSVHVRETVPDAILDEADAVELVDLPPEQLLERLKQGRVYVPEQAQRALERFFRKGNLLALRELALRRTAEHVDEDVRAYRQQHGIEATWPAAERILVCVGPGPPAARLVRAARRMAASLRAEWTAVYVETPAHAHLPKSDRDWVLDNLRLAETLGGRAVTLSGESVSAVLLRYAREQNATRIVVGKPTHPRWRDRLLGSLLDQVIRGSGDIEVYVISGDRAERAAHPLPSRPERSPPRHYVAAVAAVAAATLLAFAMFDRFELSDLILVYLLATVFVATRFGRGPSTVAATLGVLVFDFCFVPPRLSFAVSDVKYVLTFAVMLLVGLVVSGLATRVRGQAEAARRRAETLATLYEATRQLSAGGDVPGLAEAVTRAVESALSGRAIVLLPNSESRRLEVVGPRGGAIGAHEAGVAGWTFAHATPAGVGTDTLPGARGLYLPLLTGSRTLGVLGYDGAGAPLDPERRHLLDAFAAQAAVALDRALLAEEARQSELRVRTEEMRNALLSSVSHDLRTPLAAITGAASALLGREASSETARRELTQTIHEEADRLNRLVANLLEMTRLESGGLAVQKEWVPLEEVVGAALARLARSLSDRRVTANLPPELPLAPIDPILMEQVFLNLVENAVRHTPKGTPIEISAWEGPGGVVVEVTDRGPGLPSGQESRVFEKFFRGPAAPSGGSGLGLTICRGIVSAHGGTLSAENRSGGGASFRFTIPLEGAPPEVPPEAPE